MNQFVYLAVAALVAGIGLFSLSSKERNEKANGATACNGATC